MNTIKMVHIFSKRSFLKQVCLVYAIGLLLLYTTGFINYLLDIETTRFADLKAQWQIFLFVVIIAPLVETFLFQYGIIELYTFFNLKPSKISIILSGIGFSAIHLGNAQHPVYLFCLFVIGLFFGGVYFVLRNNKKHAFWVLVLAHALMNFTSFLGLLIFERL